MDDRPSSRDVRLERVRQEVRFGRQDEEPLTAWLALLGEEYGEAAHEVNALHWPQWQSRPGSLAGLRLELVQLAATTIRWIESLDRQQEAKP